ncbi:hypothetical protein GCM10010279_27640 [Streptomyces mutabilis]|nr:hypothetical protein GCM10010279_27640 [Streptomyces mutabilis]
MAGRVSGGGEKQHGGGTTRTGGAHARCHGNSRRSAVKELGTSVCPLFAAPRAPGATYRALSARER